MTAHPTVHIHDLFISYGSLDPHELSESLAQSLGLTDVQFGTLRPAIYMAASNYTDGRLAEARRVESLKRRELQLAKSTGGKSQVQKAERELKRARTSLFEQTFYNGVRDIKIGDGTVADFESAIEWKTRHMLIPAQQVIATYRGYIETIESAGVTTLRQVKS